DRLARKCVYQMLLIEEFARLGTEVRFVKGRPAETPEDALLVQFQGMIAEYDRAQIAERTRRGKVHRARLGAVNVLGGAPSATAAFARASRARPGTNSRSQTPASFGRSIGSTPRRCSPSVKSLGY